MNRPLQRILAAVPGIVFLATGILKIRDPAGFAIDIQNYRLLPWTCCVFLALYLPWLEVICGVALLSRIGYRGALAISVLLFATFIIAYGSTRFRGLDIACGCFGHGIHRGYWPVILGDSLLLALVLWLLKTNLRSLSPVIRAGSSDEANRNSKFEIRKS